MKVLLAMPHVFAPQEGSLYSSQTESKRRQKEQALLRATIGNLSRHNNDIGPRIARKNKNVVNRELQTGDGVDLKKLIFNPQ